MEEHELNQPSHYVGVGASAGGLEALQEFFSHLPPDTGAAFIVVQHLSPDFKSMMPELLSKHTAMPIHQVTDGISIQPNSIYLMPPRKNMLIGEGKLFLSDHMPENQLHMPIDIFFRALAEDQQHHAIGVVLSGTGSDGTRGIKALKESDGLVIVQEPSSAKFDGMPISARNTGLVDLVLPPDEISKSIVNFISHPIISGKEPPLKQSIRDDDDTLSEIFQILKRHSSINFSQYKASTVARRIERRLGINQLTSINEYLRLLIESPRELQILGKELLIGVTRFFRDDEAFAKLTTDIVPRIVERASVNNDEIRVWIAGCSSGEEAYSLAMLVDECVQRKSLKNKIKIFATDVDDDAIAIASAGVYSLDIAQEVSVERLDNYFTKREDSYVVSQRLRQMVIFASHNMIEDPPFSNIDLVSCRNVLIYFQHAAQKKVLSSLYFALKRDGYLFLGSSESLGDLQSHFETINERNRIFLKISNMRVPIGNAPPNYDSSMGGRAQTAAMAPINTLLKSPRVLSRNYLNSVLERLVAEYAPDSIVLNETFDAVHVYGSVEQYTKGVVSGRISNNIKDMVVDDLAVAISTALYRCEKNEDDVFYKDVAVTKGNGEQDIIDLSVSLVRDSDLGAAPRFYIVQFIKQLEQVSANKTRTNITFDAGEQSRQRIRDLEQELTKKQEHLQVTIEELETTNEELQSANEELMSANEELQSTNEELQSVNEELYTVNSEYQEKISELMQVNNDLDSVFTATDIGIVFLDAQLSIRKFTPSAAKYINLRPADISRPFHHISHELDYAELLADIANVSGKGNSVERTVFNGAEQTILVRIIPYRRSSEVGETGVLITLTNISRQRFVENALQKAQEQMRNILLDRTESIHRRILKNSTAKILLLDDDVIDRKRILRLLESVSDREFLVTPFSDLEEANNAAKKENFDICLVDYQLAGATAKDFIAGLNKNNIDAPVVILSGYAESGLDAEFLDEDVFDFLNKDELSVQLLTRSIDYVLERKQMRAVFTDLDAENRESVDNTENMDNTDNTKGTNEKKQENT